MRVVIISDIHDNISNLKYCLDWCRKEKVEVIICCGDVTNISTIEFLSKNFEGTIHMIRGNADNFDPRDVNDYLNVEYYGRMVIIELGNLKIGMCHEPYLIDKVLENGKCDVVFYGHTHKPWVENKDGVNLINPGTLSGMNSKPTFAYWGESGLELKLVEKL